MDKRPNFFVVGAPKSATSSLYAYMAQHPDIFVTEIKESHFFSYPEVQDAYYKRDYITTEADYLALYRGRTHQKAAGDFSPSYLFFNHAAQRIKNFQADAKIIMILRNPIKRAISHYLMDRRLGYQTLPLDRFFERTEENRRFFDQYINIGRYSSQVQKYYDVFGVDRVMVFIYEEFIAEKEACLKRIFQFVEVDPLFNPDFAQVHNAYRMPRSRLVQKFRDSSFWLKFRSLVPSSLKDRAKPFLDSTEKPDFSTEEQALKLIFEPDIHALSGLLNRNLNFWLEDEWTS